MSFWVNFGIVGVGWATNINEWFGWYQSYIIEVLANQTGEPTDDY